MTLSQSHRLLGSDKSNLEPREYERHGGELHVRDNTEDTVRHFEETMQVS
jgi:hypothetical protein